MNKRALDDVETKQYKVEKEPPIGSSHMVSGFFICMFILGLVLIGFLIMYSVFSNGNDKEVPADSTQETYLEMNDFLV